MSCDLMCGLDCMTSRDSTTVYPEGDLSKLIGYVSQISSVGRNYGFSAWVVGKYEVPYISLGFLHGSLQVACWLSLVRRISCEFVGRWDPDEDSE